MKTKIRARKKTVMRWISEKFGSLEMLAGVAGVDTSHPQVRMFLRQVRTSRDPVVLSIRWRAAVIEIHIEHHSSGDAAGDFVKGLEKVAAATVDPNEPTYGHAADCQCSVCFPTILDSSAGDDE